MIHEIGWESVHYKWQAKSSSQALLPASHCNSLSWWSGQIVRLLCTIPSQDECMHRRHTRDITLQYWDVQPCNPQISSNSKANMGRALTKMRIIAISRSTSSLSFELLIFSFGMLFTATSSPVNLSKSHMWDTVISNTRVTLTLWRHLQALSESYLCVALLHIPYWPLPSISCTSYLSRSDEASVILTLM